MSGARPSRPKAQKDVIDMFLKREKKKRKKQPTRVYSQLYSEDVDRELEPLLKEVPLPGKGSTRSELSTYWKSRQTI